MCTSQAILFFHRAKSARLIPGSLQMDLHALCWLLKAESYTMAHCQRNHFANISDKWVGTHLNSFRIRIPGDSPIFMENWFSTSHKTWLFAWRLIKQLADVQHVSSALLLDDLGARGVIKYHCSDAPWVNYNDVIMSSMTSRIAASQLFAQSFVRTQIRENIKPPRHWPLWGESTGLRWISLIKDPVTRKMFPFDDVIIF